MSRRGDNIHKRKDGRWEGRYIKYRNENNKAIYASVYGKTYTEVKNKLDEAKTNLQLNDDYEKIKFSYITDLWLSTNRIHIKAATYNKYYNVIKTHIEPVLGNLDINEISATIINQFLEEKNVERKA